MTQTLRNSSLPRENLLQSVKEEDYEDTHHILQKEKDAKNMTQIKRETMDTFTRDVMKGREETTNATNSKIEDSTQY